MTPEAKARQQIDQKLEIAGWVVQDMRQLNLAAGVGVAVREYPTDTGPADYVLFVNRTACGVIEATGEIIRFTDNADPAPRSIVYCWLWSQYEQTRRGASGNNQPALNKSIVESIANAIGAAGGNDRSCAVG
ncbi:hypothetical protein [Aquabacterium humicola]|uniref:hypothetical protein n=1 Tax=Aquabacterium humicola TaxID=3237377 RepID=UPI00254396CE|nr:hypothetical protein [Rubrivivax pictus]